jgi:hypothetical protein
MRSSYNQVQRNAAQYKLEQMFNLECQKKYKVAGKILIPHIYL